jgi:hypothetical protein
VGTIQNTTASKAEVQLHVRVKLNFPLRVMLNSSAKVHLADALAIRGDEGRGTLRKVSGSREQALIR